MRPDKMYINMSPSNANLFLDLKNCYESGTRTLFLLIKKNKISLSLNIIMTNLCLRKRVSYCDCNLFIDFMLKPTDTTKNGKSLFILILSGYIDQLSK